MQSMKKVLTLIVSFIFPGIGQIVCGRIAAGIAFFLSYVAILNLYILMMVATADTPAMLYRVVVIAVLAAIWLGSQSHLVYLLYIFNPEKYDDEKELVFREGLRYYISGDLADAIRQFERVLQFDNSDFDAYFYLGVCHSRDSNYKLAERFLNRCIEYDESRKWADEVQDELRLIARQRPVKRSRLGPNTSLSGRS